MATLLYGLTLGLTAKSMVDLLGWHRLSLYPQAYSNVSCILENGSLHPKKLSSTREIEHAVKQVTIATNQAIDY